MLERFETTGIARQIDALTELVAAQRVEMAALRAEIQAERAERAAERLEFQAARGRFQLEMDALRAELHAERDAFMAGIAHLQHQEEVNRQLQPARTQDIQKLVATMDAALVTMVVNQAPE
jgi:hypothetical protein